jgi:hypothetical protein
VQGSHIGMIISQNVIWNKEEFPGLSKDAHDPIPAHFGCIDAETPAAVTALPVTPNQTLHYYVLALVIM